MLGGSFNPAHIGHAHIAKTALRRLQLDQVWLMASPGNPLKAAAGMASLDTRLATARRFADGRRIIATDIESRIGSRYTWKTTRLLQRLFPRAEFVWLMGADILPQFPRWRRWTDLPDRLPIAVFPRPTYNFAALAARAALRYRFARLPARQASELAISPAPAWMFLPIRQYAISATELRKAGKGA